MFLLVLQSHPTQSGVQAPQGQENGAVKVPGIFKQSPQWLSVETTSLFHTIQNLWS